MQFFEKVGKVEKVAGRKRVNGETNSKFCELFDLVCFRRLRIHILDLLNKGSFKNKGFNSTTCLFACALHFLERYDGGKY